MQFRPLLQYWSFIGTIHTERLKALQYYVTKQFRLSLFLFAKLSPSWQVQFELGLSLALPPTHPRRK